MNALTIYKGQHYWKVGSVPHTCRDGRETTLDVWRSLCASCSKPFEFKRPERPKQFWPNRRCSVCKSPGRSVKL